MLQAIAFPLVLIFITIIINNNYYYYNVQYLLSLYLTHNIVSTIGINTQLSRFLLVRCLKLHYPTRHSLQYSHSVHMMCFGKSAISFSLKSTGLFSRTDSTLGCHVRGQYVPSAHAGQHWRRQSFRIETETVTTDTRNPAKQKVGLSGHCWRCCCLRSSRWWWSWGSLS